MRGQAHREEGVAAEVEEAFVGADRGEAEDVGEQRAQRLLAVGQLPLLPCASRRIRGEHVRGRQRRLVEFSGGGQREPVQDDERRGHEVRGQALDGHGANRV